MSEKMMRISTITKRAMVFRSRFLGRAFLSLHRVLYSFVTFTSCWLVSPHDSVIADVDPRFAYLDVFFEAVVASSLRWTFAWSCILLHENLQINILVLGEKQSKLSSFRNARQSVQPCILRTILSGVTSAALSVVGVKLQSKNGDRVGLISSSSRLMMVKRPRRQRRQ
ncbi:hypothetical protein EJB05_45507, partial [Eragrostis curvula]